MRLIAQIESGEALSNSCRASGESDLNVLNALEKGIKLKIGNILYICKNEVIKHISQYSNIAVNSTDTGEALSNSCRASSESGLNVLNALEKGIIF